METPLVSRHVGLGPRRKIIRNEFGKGLFLGSGSMFPPGAAHEVRQARTKKKHHHQQAAIWDKRFPENAG
jgi:hypothetical protein